MAIQRAEDVFTLSQGKKKLDLLYKDACCQAYLWDILREVYMTSSEGKEEAIKYFNFNFLTKDDRQGFYEAIRILEEIGYTIITDAKSQIIHISWAA